MNKLFLMKGCPGSGKSFLAKQIHAKSNNSIILSTDDFFMVNGEYKWTGNFISEAHKWNQGRCYLAIFQQFEQIIIDNTNMSTWQILPYVDVAVKHSYQWTIVEPKTKWANNAEECAKKNSHGVTKESIQRMIDNSETMDIMLKNTFGKISNSQDSYFKL